MTIAPGRVFRALLSFALALAILPDPARAAHRTTAFADFEPGPRLIAMGGAAVGAVDDPTAAFWNPAGLYFMRGTRAVVTYDDLYGQGLAKRNWVGLAWKKVHYSPTMTDNRVTLEKDLSRGAAWGITVSSLFLDLGGPSYSEFMPALSAAAGLGRSIGIGATIGFLKASSDLDGVGSTGYTATVGIAAPIPGDGRFGFTARNLFSRVFPSDGASERLALTGTAGVSWPIFGHGRVSGDLTFADGESGLSRVAAGGEYWFLGDHVAARAGIRSYQNAIESRVVPSFGVGISWKRLGFDYAYTADDSDGPGETHRFGLNVLLGRPQ